MKEYLPQNIRNLALIGHGGGGKTSLNETALFVSGEINRVGAIGEGNTVSDYTENEIERQFSISLSPSHLEWNNRKINILDTPGYTDFVGEVKAGLRVADTAVLVLKSVEGVEVGSELTYGFANAAEMPAAVVINKIDSERSDFDAVVETVKDRVSPAAAVVSFPVKEGTGANTIVNVAKMKAYKHGEAPEKKPAEIDVPDEAKERAEELRTELIEKVAELDEELMNTYLENDGLSDEQLAKGLRDSMTQRNIAPVFATSATSGLGVNAFLDFVADYFPAPTDVSAAKGKLRDKDDEIEIACDPSGEPVFFIFKTVVEQHVGELSLFRAYSGTAKAGLDLVNTTNNKGERLSQLSFLNGRNRKDADQVIAGDIGAVVKLKDTHTSNTLASKSYDVVLPPVEFPEAVIRGAIKPKAKGDEDKIGAGLHTLHEEDPSFSVKFDPEIKQTIIAGQGELQLSLAVKRLKERYGVEVELVEPRIPYRETIKGKCESAEYKHKKQSGGRGQFAHVYFKMEPTPRGEGYVFEDAIVGGVVPKNFIPAVEKGIVDIMEKGVVAGSKVIDVKVTLFDGSYHSVDSDEMSFKLAASQCFRKAFEAAKPIILEPIYELEIKVPEDAMGDVMGDISSRRGKILGMDSDGRFQILKAHVPLAELYKYSSTLRSLTGGRGMHTRTFYRYEEMPKEFEQKVIEEFKKQKEEE